MQPSPIIRRKRDIVDDPEFKPAMAFVAVLVLLIAILGLISECANRSLVTREIAMPKTGTTNMNGMTDAERTIIEKYKAAEKLSGATAAALNKLRQTPTERREAEALVTAVNALCDSAGSDFRLMLVGKDGKPLSKR